MLKRILLVWVLLFNAWIVQGQVDFSTSNPQGCAPLTTSFQVTSGTWVRWNWIFGNGNTSTLQSPSAIYSNSGFYSVTLEVWDASGQKYTRTKNQYIRVFKKPTANFIVSSSPICLWETVKFTSTSQKGDTVINKYSWDFGDGNIRNNDPINHTYTKDGKYTVSLVVTDANGCTDKIIKTGIIEVYPKPKAAFTMDSAYDCQVPTIIPFRNQSSGNNLRYSWSFGDGSTSSLFEPRHKYTKLGTYTTKLVVTDNNGCKDSMVRPNELYLGPIKIDFKGDKLEGCGLLNVNFTNIGTFNGGLNYYWEFGDGTTSDKAFPTKQYNKEGKFTVKLTVVSVFRKCSASVEKIEYIKVNHQPKGKIKLSDSFPCSVPYPISFEYIDSQKYDQLTWYTMDEEDPSKRVNQGKGNPQSTVIFTSKTQWVMVRVTTKEGCTDSFYYKRIALPTLDYDLDGDAFGCVPFNFKQTVSNIQSNRKIKGVKWFFEDGDSMTGFTVEKDFYDTGIFNYTYQIILSPNCKFNYKGKIHVGMKVDPDFEIDSTGGICNNEPIYFRNITQYKGLYIDSFKWVFDDPDDNIRKIIGPWPGFPPSYFKTNLFKKYDRDTGTIHPMLIGFHRGCPDTAYLTDSFWLKAAFAKIGEDLDICNKNQLKLFNTSSKYTRWYWEHEGDQLFSDTIVLDSRTSHKVILWIFDDSTGCWDTITYRYEPSSLSNVRLVWQDFDLCAPGFVQFSGMGFPEKNLWIMGNDTLKNLQQVKYSFKYAGVYPLKVVLEYGANCIRYLYDTVKVGDADLRGSVLSNGGCLPMKVVFYDSTFNTKFRHFWELSNGDTVWMDSQRVEFTIKNSLRDTLYAQLKSIFLRDCDGSKIFPIYVQGPGFAIKKQWSHSCSANSRFLGSLVFKNIPAAGFQVSWNMGDGNSYSTQTVNHLFRDSGMYSVSVKVMDVNGCTAEQTEKVLFSGPRVRLKIGYRFEDNKCPPIIAHFKDSTRSFGVSIRKWLWDFGDSSYSTLQHPSHQYLIPGTYSITLTVTDSMGCIYKKKFLDLIVVPGPDGKFNFGPLKGCAPLNVDFSSVVNNQTVEKEWDYGDGLVRKGADKSHVYQNPGKYIPYLIVYDSNGCKRAINPLDTIYVYPNPEVIISKQGYCLRDSIYLKASYVNEEFPVVSTQWFENSLLISTDSAFYRKFNSKKNRVCLISTNEKGCLDTSYLNLNLNQPEIRLKSSRDTICLGSDWSVSASVKGDTTIRNEYWLFNDSLMPSNSRMLQLVPKYSQIIKIQYYSEDERGCWDTAYNPKNLVVGDTQPGQPPLFRRVSVVDDNTHELVLSQYPNFDFAGYQVYWKSETNYQYLKNSKNALDTYIINYPVNALDQIYCYKISSKNLCGKTQDLNKLKEHCSVELDGFPKVNASELNWNFYTGWPVESYTIYRKNLITQLFDSIGVVSGDVNVFIDSSIVCYKKHEYRVKAKERNGLNEHSWSDTCHVLPIYINSVYPPIVKRVSVIDDLYTHLNWEENDSNITEIDHYLIFRKGNAQNSEKWWKVIGNSDSLVLKDPSVFVDLSSYSYLLKGVDECNDSSDFSLISKSILLKVNLNEQYETELKWNNYLEWKDGVKEYIIEVNNGTGFVEIGRVDSSRTSFVHPNQAFNCIDKLDYRITAVPNKWIPNTIRWYEISTSNVSSPVHRAKVFIPNAFTPNQNDLNELFKPDGVFIQSYHLKIFNRWGEKLYDKNGCGHGWDGKFNGELAPEGVYIYQCSIKGVNGERHVFSGDVTLLR